MDNAGARVSDPLCIGIVFAALYPLGRERHAQVRAELAARRADSLAAE